MQDTDCLQENNIDISVIVPVYNVEDYLRECIDSLVNQTLKNIEIIVINDGSTDNSQAIIDEYQKNYPDIIKSFTKPNSGLSDTRNFGVERANGKYIAFVDSDDFVDCDFYEQMVNKAIKTNSDIVCCPVSYIYKKTVQRNYYNPKNFGKNVRTKHGALRQANSFAWNKIFLRSFWLKNGFKFANQWFEDSHLIYNVMLLANKVALVNIPFYNYRKDRTNSIINTVDNRIFDIFKSTDNIIKFYKEHDAYLNMYDVVCYISIRHIYGRLQLLIKSRNKSMTFKFLKYMYKYFKKNFPDWRKCSFLKVKDTDKKEDRIIKRLVIHKVSLYLYVLLFRDISFALASFLRLFKSKKSLDINPAESEKQNEMKRFYVQKNGIKTIQDVQNALSEIGVTSFADFGTCLGLIREGHLLTHDKDVDIGVIAERIQQNAIRVALERAGLRLWRQYIYNGYIAEESYYYKRIKIDINYYIIDNEVSKTWLFYRKPKTVYDSNFRHIVEMRYSPIKGTRDITIDDVTIKIPENAEELMMQKYGKNWRKPDKGWIYWKSPAATRLPDIGYYLTYRYKSRPKAKKGKQLSEKQLNRFVKLLENSPELTQLISEVVKSKI